MYALRPHLDEPNPDIALFPPGLWGGASKGRSPFATRSNEIPRHCLKQWIYIFISSKFFTSFRHSERPNQCFQRESEFHGHSCSPFLTKTVVLLVIIIWRRCRIRFSLAKSIIWNIKQKLKLNSKFFLELNLKDISCNFLTIFSHSLPDGELLNGTNT